MKILCMTLGTGLGALALASAVAAAPVGQASTPGTPPTDVVTVHGVHRTCQLGPAGWHRHNRFGDRIPCQRWSGVGPRPSACVRVGGIWWCG